MNLLSVSGIRKQEAQEEVLKGISFTQKPLQKIAIAGESGSGKSTLLKIVAGLGQATSGEVVFEGKKVRGLLEKLMPGHPGIAYLSQHYELRNNYRVEEELDYANLFFDEDAAELYRICRIDHLLKRWTTQLSGGEKQRISLAKQLATSPRLLVLDEPFSNLDLVHKQTLKSVISDIGEKLNITILLVSHDPLDILSWADEIILMKDGQIVQQGDPKTIYRKPASEYTAGLFGKFNLVDAALFGAKKVTGKKLFLRPENILLAKDGVEGVVTKVEFVGFGYDLEVAIGRHTVVLRVNDEQVKAGDTLHLALDKQARWYM